jgi:hypothetical protein
MAIFYHVDVRDEIQPGETLTAMPVTSSKYPEDASELNSLFPQGVSFFGASVMLHMDPNSPDATIEQILETIRRKFIEKCEVDYPSRMSSVFACDDLDSARQFRIDFQRQHGRIWEVECDDFFKGDMNFVCHDMLNNHDLAVHYWQGLQKGERPFWEYLLRPPVTVVREITV